MASIQKRLSAAGDPSWRVMYRIDGKQVSDSFTDPAAAERYRKLVETIGGQAARDSLAAHTRSHRQTLDEWFEHYLAHLTNATAGTIAEYRRLAKRTWLPALGHLPVDVISKDAIRKWVGAEALKVTKRGTPTSAKTLANAHGLLSQTFAGAVEAELRLDNPAKKVALPEGTVGEMVFLTHNEFAALFAKVPAHWKPLVATLAGTGMRWGEATALRWQDVDLDADVPTATIAQAWKRGPTTRYLGAPKSRKGRRRISLPREVVTELRAIRPDKATGYVFVGPQGGRVHHQAFHPRVWRPAVEASGIDKNPRIHDLRHSHAAWMLALNLPIHVLQHRLGHKSIKTTVDVYGHLMGDAQTQAAEAASLALSSAMPAIEG